VTLTAGPAASAAGPARAGSSVDLLWIPLGAGGRSIGLNGRIVEAVAARVEHRSSLDLYHSALQVRLGADRYTVEMAPAWGNGQQDRGVTAVGAVGMRRLGSMRPFQYEVRRWRSGIIGDAAAAVGGARRLTNDALRAQQLLELVPQFPVRTWGRDEQGTGDMWNSNSLTAWLLALSGQDMSRLAPPDGGRAPGWHAGLVVARRRLHYASGSATGRRPPRPARDVLRCS
jgi:hypothetical protein